MVAFTVSEQVSKTYSPEARIEFTTVITNEGAGFKPGQHEFVCPVSGMYLFTYTTLSIHNQHSISSIWIENTLLVTSFGNGPNNGKASNTVLVHCNSGNKVYVQCDHEYVCYTEGDNRNYHTFAGFLVSADVTP